MSGPRRNPVDASEKALAIVHQTLIGEAVDHSPMLAFVADEHMRYVAVNQRVCEVLGYTRDEIMQRWVADIAIEASAPAEFAEMIAIGFRAGVAMLRRKDGETVEFSYFASEVRIAGLPFYLSVGVVTA